MTIRHKLIVAARLTLLTVINCLTFVDGSGVAGQIKSQEVHKVADLLTYLRDSRITTSCELG